MSTQPPAVSRQSPIVRYPPLSQPPDVIRQVAEELRSHTAQLQQQEEVWRREQGMLADAETQRRQILIAEENKLTQQRIRYVAGIVIYRK